MGAQDNNAPVIIKRKKIIGGGGHHGGAWKVAYADFVTAMMAFFMLMWLLNATTEQQRKGIADYFSPTIPINRVSGGGNGAFGGDSLFAEETLPKNGTGSTGPHGARENRARGDFDISASEGQENNENEIFKDVDAKLMGRGGETMVMDNTLKHIVTRITDEGLVIELFELDQRPLFDKNTEEPTQLLKDLVTMIASAAKVVTNKIAVEGHVSSDPIVLAERPVWRKSIDRATKVRHLLEDASIPEKRISRMTGHADREPVVQDSMAQRNNRIEIILLRKKVTS